MLLYLVLKPNYDFLKSDFLVQFEFVVIKMCLKKKKPIVFFIRLFKELRYNV